MVHKRLRRSSGQPLGPESPSFTHLVTSCAALRLSVAHSCYRSEDGAGGRDPLLGVRLYPSLIRQQEEERKHSCGWHLIGCTDLARSVPLGSQFGTSLLRRSRSSPMCLYYNTCRREIRIANKGSSGFAVVGVRCGGWWRAPSPTPTSNFFTVIPNDPLQELCNNSMDLYTAKRSYQTCKAMIYSEKLLSFYGVSMYDWKPRPLLGDKRVHSQ